MTSCLTTHPELANEKECYIHESSSLHSSFERINLLSDAMIGQILGHVGHAKFTR